jgi:hypothetical protein
MQKHEPITGLPASASDYFRWGIPSVVLAVITTVLWTYSSLVVQPGLQEKYRRICDANLVSLGLIETNGTPQGVKLELDATERRALLDQTDLCLRRLIVWDNSNAVARYQSGLVAAASSQWYSEMATQVTGADVSTGYRAASGAAIGKAADAMRAAEKLGGEYGRFAATWLVSRELNAIASGGMRSEDGIEALHRLTSRLAGTASQDSMQASAAAVMAQAQLLLALHSHYRSFDEASIQRRRSVAAETVAVLGNLSTANVEQLGWRAEAEMLAGDDMAYATGRQVVSKFWDQAAIDSASPDDIVAVYKSMLMVGDVMVAEAFMASRLKKLTPDQQGITRRLASGACLRLLVGRYISERWEAPPKPTLGDLLALATEFHPQSHQVVELFSRMVEFDRSDALTSLLKQELSERRGDRLSALVQMIASLESGAVAEARIYLESAIAADTTWATTISELSSSLVEAEVLTIGHGLLIFDWLTEARPSEPLIWFSKAAFCAKHKEYDKSIATLEVLNSMLPGNSQIESFLVQVKDQAALSTEASQASKY